MENSWKFKKMKLKACKPLPIYIYVYELSCSPFSTNKNGKIKIKHTTKCSNFDVFLFSVPCPHLKLRERGSYWSPRLGLVGSSEDWRFNKIHLETTKKCAKNSLIDWFFFRQDLKNTFWGKGLCDAYPPQKKGGEFGKSATQKSVLGKGICQGICLNIDFFSMNWPPRDSWQGSEIPKKKPTTHSHYRYS